MLTIQFGQCGNQLGHSLFQQLSTDVELIDKDVSRDINKHYTEQAFEKWFTGITKDGRHIPRAILVDTEKKVINQFFNDPCERCSYSVHNVVCPVGGGGSANNWGYGYLVKGPHLKDAILEATRKELEKTDCFEGFFSLLSSAGGTGSGVSSYTADILRSEFPTKTAIAAIVLPFASGEVVTQNYNTLFALVNCNKAMDMTLLFENEQIHAICKNVLKNPRVELDDINEIMSRKICALLQPLNENNDNSKYSLNSLTSLIAPHPSYKIATIKSTPYVPLFVRKYETLQSWEFYMQHIKQTLRIPMLQNGLTDVEVRVPSRASSARTSYAYARSVSSVLVSRGQTTDNDLVSTEELQDKNLYVDWIPKNNQFCYLKQERKLLNQEKFLALVTNSSQIHQTLDLIVEKAWKMYTHAAYIHQYKKYGLEDDDFLQAFAKMENIIKDYKNL